MKSSTTDAPMQSQRKQSIARSLSAILGLQVLIAGAFGILSPILSIIMTEYFAKLHRNGSQIDCEVNPHDEACIAGSQQAAWLSSIFSAAGCMGNFILSPMLGQASDVCGRKVTSIEIIGECTIKLGIPFAIILFVQLEGSITPYFVLRLLDSSFGFSAGVMSAAVADVVAPEDRATAFGILFASLSVGYCLSAFAAPFFSRDFILKIAAVLFALRIVWAVFLLPETLSAHTRMKNTSRVVENPISSMAILIRDKLFMRLTGLIALTSFVVNGVFQIQPFFLNTIVEFDIQDFSKLTLLGGILALVGQILILKPLVNCVREKGVIVIALVANTIGASGFALTAYYPHKWLIYALCIPGCISDLSLPAISALKSMNVSEKEQGRLQGSIYGARSIFEALGPVIFASLYGAMTTQSIWSQAFPYMLASLLYLLGIGMALWLPAGKGVSSRDFVAASAPLMSPTNEKFLPSTYFEINHDDKIEKEDTFDNVLCASLDEDVNESLVKPLLGTR
ncbi:hypothetical protein CCR75_003783 [Bremia lactucae]|uniref:Major facilitator superfamily (MFS) profile domain-containing protein n=1 Tax=Bremia lactucae TaxID=4779 RepID=A0A976IJF4_BRELC|nr:hypothetical protein CCR75_003783 [Bremia lactucae]